MASVQFKGIEAVLEAFDNRNIEAWSLWERKQFLFKGIGSEELEQILKALANGGSNATYTLKVYEGITASGEIKSNTADDGSFNFRLNSEGQELTNSQYTAQANTRQLLERMDKIEEMLLAEQEPEKPPETIGSVLMDVIKDPVKLTQWVDIAASVLSGRVFNQPIRPAIGAAATSTAQSADEKLQRIAAAIDILDANDNRFVDHLEILAKLSLEKPDNFKFLLLSLEGLK